MNLGVYSFKLVRKGEVIAEGDLRNTVTIEGRQHMLNTQFRGGSQQGSWFFGLMNNVGWSANPETDQMANHPGWTEFTSYSEGSRQQWSPAAPSGAAISNSAAAVFTLNSSGALKGFFISSNSTKSGTAGTLWSSVPFSTGVLNVASGDEIRLTYSYGING